MDYDYIAGEIEGIFNPEPDEDDDYREWRAERLGKHHGLDFTYLEGATSHRSTRLWPEGEMYTKPSVALDKLRLRPQARSLDIPEEECSPLETEEYNKEFASPAAGSDKVK